MLQLPNRVGHLLKNDADGIKNHPIGQVFSRLGTIYFESNRLHMLNVKLAYYGNRRGLGSAVSRANDILANDAFYRQITAYERFDNSALSPEILARLLSESDYEIRVRVRWLLPIFGSTRFDRIVISGWESEYPTARLVNLLIHETVNAMDDLYNIFEDRKRGEAKSSMNASFVIGSIAETFVR